MPDEYRRRAVECLRLADEVADPNNKASLIEIASAWLRLQAQAERNREADLANEMLTRLPRPQDDMETH